MAALVPEMFSTVLSVLGAVMPACLPSLDAAAVGDILRQVWSAALEHADLSVVSSFAAFAFSPVFLPFHEQLRPVRHDDVYCRDSQSVRDVDIREGVGVCARHGAPARSLRRGSLPACGRHVTARHELYVSA